MRGSHGADQGTQAFSTIRRAFDDAQLGPGGCQALEDAVVFGNSQRTHNDPIVAFRSYEQQCSARTRQIVQQSRRIGQIGQWSNPWLCSIRNGLVRRATPVQDLAARRVIGYRV
jgi:2-polyprenyl-6-methoxyphenol hydroxylase-like FAD-dependent oxidoreductase